MAIKRLYDTLVGATVNVNQLVDSNTSSIIIPTGHKYYAIIVGTASIGASTGTAISVTGGTDMLTDLTAYFGSTIADYLYSLETATAGAGIAKLKEWGFFTDKYIPCNPGSLESVEARSHVMRGFNQWDEEVEAGIIDFSSGVPYANTSSLRSKNFCKIIPGASYYLKCGDNTDSRYWMAIIFYDKSYQHITSVYGNAQTIQAPTNAHYFKIATNPSSYVYGTTYNNDICINLSSDRNGEYEPYKANTYDLGTDTLRGLFKLDSNNNLYADGDRKASDGTITRYYGTRAYQSGDESLADAITDGTTTVYKLTTPTTEQGDPFPSPQIVYPDGTEEYVTSNGIPVGHETRYQL